MIFEYAYPVEHGFDFTLACLASIAKPPLAALTSFLSDASAAIPASNPWNDPMLNGRRRLWLLALNFAVAVIFASFTWRRLSHPRACAARWVWTIATLLLGAPAVMARLVVEPVFNTEVSLQQRRAPANFVLRTR